MSSIVVVPTYNEVENLPALAEMIMELPEFSLLVVDDNSPDGTGDLAEELRHRFPGRIELLRRSGKLGLGTAYLEGFRIALRLGHSHLFQMDADFSHDPADLPRLLAELRRGADLVIASRYAPGGGTEDWPFWRLAMSRGGSLYARAVLGLPILDVTGGYRGWRRQTLLDLPLELMRSQGYSFQLEMAYRCVRAGKRVVEIPIRFLERRNGVSKMSTAIFLEAVVAVWRLRLEEMKLLRPLREALGR